MIYLDYNASTPIDPAAREAMLPFLGAIHGNPSSVHALGRRVRQAVEHARTQVANLIGAKPSEIVFTSGGTEANNMVIKGVARKRGDRGRHVITSAIEHPAVLEPCRILEEDGFEITRVAVDGRGRVDPASVVGEVRPDTILISIMHANNEVGTIQPIAEIAEAAREGGIWMHTDAAQSVGKVPIDVNRLGVDFLSIAGHKLYAPQGVGALFVRDGIDLPPLIHGAGHEGGRRAGTEAVPAIVGLGAAAESAAAGLDDPHCRVMRDRLWAGLEQAIGDGVIRHGDPEGGLPNTLNVSLKGVIGRELLAAVPDLCASPGAACHGGRHAPSAVLTAMGVPPDAALGAIRLSVGRETTADEIDRAVVMIAGALAASPKQKPG
jgi:cysteine desulfurase